MSGLVLGVGCARGCPVEELAELVRGSLAEAGIAATQITRIASLDLKRDEPAVAALAATFGVPLVLFDAARLEAETPRLANPSEVVYAAVGCHGVAEGAALAAAGPRAQLVMTQRRSAHATCALAGEPT